LTVWTYNERSENQVAMLGLSGQNDCCFASWISLKLLLMSHSVAPRCFHAELT